VKLSRYSIRDFSNQARLPVTQVVSMAPELLHTPLDVSTAAEFFSAKLADRCTVCLRIFAFTSEVWWECTCHIQPRSSRSYIAFLPFCRVCIHAALTGCLAMLLRKAAATASLPALDAVAAAVVVMKRFLQHILVQAHGQVDRMLSFDILLASLQVLQWLA
jgi:hypothetical protein